MNKDCPYCKLSVPKDLEKCKCGYLFEGYNESGVTKPSPKVFREITDFDMPFLMKADQAANIIFKDLIKGKKFEIAFPKIFVILLKLLKFLPYKFYFYFMIKKIMYKLVYRNNKK